MSAFNITKSSILSHLGRATIWGVYIQIYVLGISKKYLHINILETSLKHLSISCKYPANILNIVSYLFNILKILSIIYAIPYISNCKVLSPHAKRYHPQFFVNCGRRTVAPRWLRSHDPRTWCPAVLMLCWCWFDVDTVDGRNPAPVDKLIDGLSHYL